MKGIVCRKLKKEISYNRVYNFVQKTLKLSLTRTEKKMNLHL